MINIKRVTAAVLLLLTATSTPQVAAKQEICRALALSGGGAKGSYEAGVIHGLVHLLDPEDVKYDVVTGVSAGAINAAAISLWDIGNEKEMA